MRIAHLSDLHYAAETLAQVDACVAAAIAAATQNGCEVGILSGDAFDHGLHLHQPAVAALTQRLRAWADTTPIVILQGTFSHDTPGSLDIFKSLGGAYPIYVADRITQVALTPSGWKEPENGGWRFTPDTIPDGARLLVSALPTVNQAILAATVGADASLGHYLEAVLAGWADVNRAAARSGIPTVVVSHGTVSGCTTEHGVPMAGLDHEFTLGSLFATEASAIMLGHIHKSQSWTHQGRTIAYAGSIARLHYGEDGEKGWLQWEVATHAAQCTLRPTPARKTVDIVFDGTPDLSMIEARARELRGADVRVRWSVPETERASVDTEAVCAALRAAGARDLKLEGTIVPIVTARAPGISTETSLAMQLKRWQEASGMTVENWDRELTDLATSTPKDIAESRIASLLECTGRAMHSATIPIAAPQPQKNTLSAAVTP